MQISSLVRLCYAMTGLAALVGASAVSIGMENGWSSVLEEVQPASVRALPAPFAQPEALYAALGQELPLHIQERLPTLQPPKLKNILIYHGKNGRPDASGDRTALHFGFQGAKTIASATDQQPLYFIYDRNAGGSRYAFSPDNQPSHMWLTAQPSHEGVEVRVTLCDEEDRVIEGEPLCFAEKDSTKGAPVGQWEIGPWRVDPTLLSRQKARWGGVDRFLEQYGGDVFSHCVGRQRIDFGEGEQLYSLYVRMGDCLAWSEERWQLVEPGVTSIDKPLLVVKRIDDRVMTVEIWDVGGKNRTVASLVRMADSMLPQQLTKDFRFVGARTKSQVVFEIQNQRMVLRPHDWLILTSEGWKKIDSIETLDAYVDRKLTGPLLVVEEVGKKEEKQILAGRLFNASRSESHEIELVMGPTGGFQEEPHIPSLAIQR